MEKIAFDEDTREAVVAEAEGRGLLLLNEHNHVGGDFLVFGTPEEKAAIERREARDALAASDREMARGAEDLYQALIAKGVLVEGDLPGEFVAKVAARSVMRSRL